MECFHCGGDGECRNDFHTTLGVVEPGGMWKELLGEQCPACGGLHDQPRNCSACGGTGEIDEDED